MDDVGRCMGKAVREPEAFLGGGTSGRMWKGGQLGLQCWDLGMQPAHLLKTEPHSLGEPWMVQE